jgi:predicted DNA-binding transcriptional regulator AlpA
MSTAPDRYLKIREVAQRISVCTKSVRNYIANGDFGPVMRLSQTDIRIPESGLQKFIRERLT